METLCLSFLSVSDFSSYGSFSGSLRVKGRGRILLSESRKLSVMKGLSIIVLKEPLI